jgi:hypothetical protein
MGGLEAPLQFPMHNKLENGKKWNALAIQLTSLWQPLAEFTQESCHTWTPTIPSTEEWEDQYTAWREVEQQYIPEIHAAGIELIRTGELPHATTEILYFLHLRLRASIDHVHTLYVVIEGKPVSLTPFPPVEPNTYAEWLMTEWSDEHAIVGEFPFLTTL